MKKHFYRIGLALFSALLVIGCVEKDEISQWNSLYDLREQNVELKDMCYKINNNINSIQKLLEAQKDNLGIKSVTNVADGYIIVFSDDTFITLLNGKDGADGKDGKDGVNGKDGINGVDGKDGADGKDGVDGKDGNNATAYIPSISVKLSDGVYYWTLDGEFLTDDEGNKICAQGLNGKDGVNGVDGKDGADGKDGVDGKDGKDAVVPQLKVEDDNWLISYDDGNTWKTIGSASGANGKDGKDGKDGITPQIKIEDGKYLVSYDNGDSWTSIGGSSFDSNSLNPTISGYVDGYAYVDLGLPSGLKWATMNVGAENVFEYGDFYAWGEVTQPRDGKYSAANCRAYDKSLEQLVEEGIIKSVEEPNLTKDYDAATVYWGSHWRMPVKEEFDELVQECIWTLVTFRGIKGYKVESVWNGNWIFIPVSGYHNELYEIFHQDEEYGIYWSSTTFYSKVTTPIRQSYQLRFNTRLNSKEVEPLEINYGHKIRPVTK